MKQSFRAVKQNLVSYELLKDWFSIREAIFTAESDSLGRMKQSPDFWVCRKKPQINTNGVSVRETQSNGNVQQDYSALINCRSSTTGIYCWCCECWLHMHSKNTFQKGLVAFKAMRFAMVCTFMWFISIYRWFPDYLFGCVKNNIFLVIARLFFSSCVKYYIRWLSDYSFPVVWKAILDDYQTILCG